MLIEPDTEPMHQDCPQDPVAHRSHFPIGFIGQSQERMRDDPRPAPPQMQVKAAKGLAIGMIFAIAGLTAKAHTPGRTSKAADGQRHAVDDADQFIVADQLITQQHPQTLFKGPQIGSLPHKGRAMDRLEYWEKVA